MSGISPQAQRIIDVVRALGIPRSGWSVRTQTKLLRHGGRRYREYDDAVLYWRSIDAREAIVDAAQQLADAGLDVTLIRCESGTVMPIVTSASNPRRKVHHA